MEYFIICCIVETIVVILNIIVCITCLDLFKGIAIRDNKHIDEQMLKYKDEHDKIMNNYIKEIKDSIHYDK